MVSTRPGWQDERCGRDEFVATKSAGGATILNGLCYLKFSYTRRVGRFGHVIEVGTVMSFVKHHGDLVKIITQFLNKIGLRNKKFRTADLGLVFNLVAQADYNNNITIPVDK